MKKIFIILLMANFILLSFEGVASERTSKIMKADTTERLENIQELKKSIRSMKLRLKSFEIAILEAKKKPTSYRVKYSYIKKISEVITTLSLLVVTVEAYRTKNLGPNKVVKPASVVAAISSAISGVSGVLLELSDNELELLNNNVKELRAELSATEKNLNEESDLLCSQEPSNQMCLSYIQK